MLVIFSIFLVKLFSKLFTIDKRIVKKCFKYLVNVQRNQNFLMLLLC